MIEEPKALTINGARKRPSQAQIDALSAFATSVVSDAMWGTGALHPDITPLRPDMHAIGPALTVDCRPGDLLGLLAALAYVRHGDVVVCTTHGHRAHATIGDRVAGMLRNSGAAGFVTDGTLRDADGVEATGLPIWSTGITPASPVSNGPGRVGFPITLGGQPVRTGDLVVADRDGVVIVPLDALDATATRAGDIVALEDGLDAQVQDGLRVPDAITAMLASDATDILD